MGLKFHSKILDVDNIDVSFFVFDREEESLEPVRLNCFLCFPVGYGEDDGPGSSADYYLPGSVSHGDPEPQRRGGGGRPCKFLIQCIHT